MRSLRNSRCARLNDKPSFRALAARCARGVQESLAQKQRARGKPGVRCTRGRAWCVVNTRVSHHRFTGSIRLSARNGFNGFLRALPGDRACLSPSSADDSANLTPASGCQDHTTSPFASGALVRSTIRVHRIPPRVRDDRDTPLCGARRRWI